MKLPRFARLRPQRSIPILSGCKWLVFPVFPIAFALRVGGNTQSLLFMLLCGMLFGGMRAWEQSLRRRFVRESVFPRILGHQLKEAYPQLSRAEVDLVFYGLRQFFVAHLRSSRQFVAMPSKIVDVAWHAFILHTRAYDAWCTAAFGSLLHHTPAEVLGRDPRRNNGLRRTWYWACKEESIDPRKPSRLPLLFALDKKLSIVGGFSYSPDCRDIDRKSASGDHCGADFGSSTDGGAGGDADSFGGSEASGSDSSGDSASCGGGCGGGD
jgi:hypothetical protein